MSNSLVFLSSNFPNFHWDKVDLKKYLDKGWAAQKYWMWDNFERTAPVSISATVQELIVVFLAQNRSWNFSSRTVSAFLSIEMSKTEHGRGHGCSWVVHGMFLPSCMINMMGKSCDAHFFVDWYVLDGVFPSFWGKYTAGLIGASHTCHTKRACSSLLDRSCFQQQARFLA